MKRSMGFRIVDILLCAAAAAGLAAAVWSGFKEEERTEFLLLLIAAVALFLVFLATRVRWGCAALFLTGSILCAGAYFLQFPIPPWAFLLFEFAAAAEYLWRTWHALARRAETGEVRFGAGAAQIFLFCLVGFAVAGGVYYAVARPLDPPTRELKLIRELKRMDLLQVLGVSRTEIVLDPELDAEEPPEDEEQGGESGEDESDALDDMAEETPPAPPAAGEGLFGGAEDAAAVSYDRPGARWLWLLLLLIPAAAVLAFALRARARRRWRERVKALPGRDAVVNYYRHFLSGLARAGCPRPPQQTLSEYAARNETALQPFAREEGGFARLTGIYEKALYGRGEIGPEEAALFERTCDAFPAALKRELGPVRYYLTLLWN